MSGCEFFETKAQVMQCHRGALTQRCKANNCYYKQLARKTQECEGLKAYAQRQENQREIYYKEFLRKDKALEELKDKLKIYEKMFDNPEFTVALTDIRTGERDIREQRDKRLTKEFDRYLKALEEIEDFRKKHCDFWCEGNRILDIINKAKGEENVF